MAKAKKRAGSTRKKKVDTDLLFVGVLAFIVAAATFYWKGSAEFMWYGIPAVIGIALVYQAYM